MSGQYPLDTKKICIVLCSITCLLILALIAGKEKLFSENIPYYWIAGMIVFLFFYGFRSIIIVNKKAGVANPRQMVSLYMMLKGVKIFLFFAALLIYMLGVKIEVKRFVLAATILYLIYLLLDVFFLVSVEKNLKKNGK
ncbi:MAG: hypothetical protein FWF52_01555 [Candidatus Azobacteroides sp.]|nr:hypothetical protein [Candidatus Azobacteroides sp.]